MRAFFRKFAVLVAALVAGDLAGVYHAKMYYIPAYDATNRPFYRTVALTGTSLVVFRSNRWMRLVLWPTTGYIIFPGFFGALFRRLGVEYIYTPENRKEDEQRGIWAGIVLATVSIMVGSALRRRSPSTS